MCDYSLHSVASRSAKVGDDLVTTKFNGTSTRGFSALGDPNVAVCILPGTEIVFVQEAELDRPFAWLIPWSRSGKLGQTLARFRQINSGQSSAHHDALEFADGKVVLVTKLRTGLSAKVLQLPASIELMKPSKFASTDINELPRRENVI